MQWSFVSAISIILFFVCFCSETSMDEVYQNTGSEHEAKWHNISNCAGMLFSTRFITFLNSYWFRTPAVSMRQKGKTGYCVFFSFIYGCWMNWFVVAASIFHIYTCILSLFCSLSSFDCAVGKWTCRGCWYSYFQNASHVWPFLDIYSINWYVCCRRQQHFYSSWPI